jgi:hypothetical protein
LTEDDRQIFLLEFLGTISHSLYHLPWKSEFCVVSGPEFRHVLVRFSINHLARVPLVIYNLLICCASLQPISLLLYSSFGSKSPVTASIQQALPCLFCTRAQLVDIALRIRMDRTCTYTRWLRDSSGQSPVAQRTTNCLLQLWPGGSRQRVRGSRCR